MTDYYPEYDEEGQMPPETAMLGCVLIAGPITTAVFGLGLWKLWELIRGF